MGEKENLNTQEDQTEEQQQPPETSDIDSDTTLDEIAGNIGANMPEPDPEFSEKLEAEAAGRQAEQQRPEPPQAEEFQKPPKDKKGFYFDPRYCEVDDNGQPVMTVTGLFKMKGKFKRHEVLKKRIIIPQRPTIRTPGTEEDPAADMPSAVDVDRMECETIAGIFDNLYWTATTAVFQKVGMKNPDISAAGKAAMTEYLLTMENRPNLPGWFPLLAIYGTSTAAMIAHPESRPKVKTWRERLAFWFGRLIGRRQAAAEQED